MVAILSGQRELILDAVRAMYTAVARSPQAGFHFPVGLQACELVGYPTQVSASLPEAAIESFAGVGYPFAANVIREGDTVLDIGSGSGTDLLIARQLAGETGTVIGLDLTDAMLDKLARLLGDELPANVRLLRGNAEEIPLPDASVDVVTSNGVLNLVPDKQRAIAEIHRVLRPGGRLQIADVVLGRPLDPACQLDPKLWAECVVGATPEEHYLELFLAAGFEQVQVLGRFDYFAASSSPETRSIAAGFQAHALVLRGAKPPGPQLPQALAWRPRAAGEVAAAESVSAAAIPAPDRVVDASGQICGTIEPLLKAALRELQSGQVLELAADDVAARLGIPSWCRLTGHQLLETIQEDERRTRFLVRKK